MYKDKNKQREANKERQRRYKDRQKALPEQGVTSQKALLSEGVTREALPEDIHPDLPACVKPERTALGNIRVSKPGDDDYVPMCETTRAFIDNRDKRPSTAKRGLDIKCFNDLPPDVQATINRLSESNEEKAKRTAAAIKYQHLFPDRYHSTGLSRTSSTKGARL